MVAVADVPPAVVVAVNVAVLLPAAMVTVAGTIAALLLLDKATEMPPLGAAAVNVTVPPEDAPPGTLVGLRDTDVSVAGAVTVRAAVLLTLLYFAVMVAVAAVVPDVVVTVKVEVVPPAATVTVAGTFAIVLLLESATEIPPMGAALVNVIVPVDDVPPVTLVGLRDTDDSATEGVIVSAAVLLTLL